MAGILVLFTSFNAFRAFTLFFLYVFVLQIFFFFFLEQLLDCDNCKSKDHFFIPVSGLFELCLAKEYVVPETCGPWNIVLHL